MGWKLRRDGGGRAIEEIVGVDNSATWFNEHHIGVKELYVSQEEIK